MAERIYKGTAEVNGVVKPVTYKIVNAPESRANDLEILRQHHGDLHKNMKLTHVYDSDRPTQYATPNNVAPERPQVPAEFMSPVEPQAMAGGNPVNVPPPEASVPPANAPTGDAEPKPAVKPRRGE